MSLLLQVIDLLRPHAAGRGGRGEARRRRSRDGQAVKVRDFEGRTVHRTMRRSEKLKALIDLYYATVHAAEGNGTFIFDGRLLRGWETPAELEMEDGHEVEYFPSWLFGCCLK